MKPINVGLLGIGTVGGGTYAVLKRNARRSPAAPAVRFSISVVADRNLDRTRELTDGSLPGHRRRFCGGLRPGGRHRRRTDRRLWCRRELVLQAIANGKHVVTANKALLAKHGNEIFAAAQTRA
jgi:homoserine dehydrogenase